MKLFGNEFHFEFCQCVELLRHPYPWKRFILPHSFLKMTENCAELWLVSITDDHVARYSITIRTEEFRD
jgi:hypothetical protein